MSNTVIPMQPKGQGRGEVAGGRRKSARLSQFMINKQSAVPLHIQLKEQIRYAIMSGGFQPGSPLPSIRELTAQLGIHRNTVHRVYLELQAQGLLLSRPGKGVFVSDSIAEGVSVEELNAADALIERTFHEANALGINPNTLARLFGQRAPAYDARHAIVAFVECTKHQSQEFSRDLAESFGIRVQHLLLDDMRARPDGLAGHVRHLITSAFHYDEVKALAQGSGRKVHPVTYDLHPATRRLLRELGPETQLGFVCHDANTEEVIGRQIHDRVAANVLVGCANLETPQMALELIGRVDTVIFSEPAQQFCITNCTPDHELLELHYALNSASVEKVTRALLFQP